MMCGFSVHTSIEGDVLGINNGEPKVLVQELPLWENKCNELHSSSTLLPTLHMKEMTFYITVQLLTATSTWPVPLSSCT